MHDTDTKDPKEQRKFGLIMAAAIAILGFVRYSFHWWRLGHMPEALPWAFFAVAALFAVTGLVLPGVLQPIMVAWFAFGRVLNKVMTAILLTMVFFLTMAPIGLCMRAFGADKLKRRWDRDAATYWEEPDLQPDKLEDYYNQY